MLVEHVVNRNVSTVRADDDVLTAARRLLDCRCGVLPVVVEEERGARVIGLLRHRDAFAAAYGRADRPAAMPVEAVMAPPVCTGRPSGWLGLAGVPLRRSGP